MSAAPDTELSGTEPPATELPDQERMSFFAGLGLREAPLVDGIDAAVEIEVREAVMNPRGGLQGGLVATLVDIAAGKAALAGLPHDLTVATATLTLNYLSAVTVGPARAQATVLRRGRSLIVVGVEITDVGSERLAAVGTVSFSVLELRDGQADPGRAR
jgi:uncharacterized protein (TIGR00369 family)